MKLDTHGIRFRFWLVFFFLAVGITLFIGALQLGLIRPYYRNSKIESVTSLADEIQKDLFTNEISSYSVNDALRQAVNNNACVVIFNVKGEQIYQADSIGSSCLFQKPMEQSVQVLLSMDSIKVLTDNAEHDFSQNMTNRITGQEMIIYGRLVKANLANYYLFVNSALEPVDSVVTFFTQQYAVYMIAAILLASVLAMYISQKVTNPIVMMNKEAHKLSKADYSAVFNGGSFTETNELANSLNDANTQLAKIDELRRDLMANVSH
ncbi:MAG: hypothetical protein IJ875_07595, partial [Solobacterium sp.]|nr:hypothetical protein [Solobacterium sp.]